MIEDLENYKLIKFQYSSEKDGHISFNPCGFCSLSIKRITEIRIYFHFSIIWVFVFSSQSKYNRKIKKPISVTLNENY